MVVYFKTNILLAIVFIFLGASSSFEDYEIENICKYTPNPKFCFKILKSTPLTEQSDVVGMEKFLVNYVQRNVSTTINLLQEIIRKYSDPRFSQSTDPRSIGIYKSSLTQFKWAATYCKNALEACEKMKKDVFAGFLLDVARMSDDNTYYLQNHVRPDPGPQIIARLGVIQDVCYTAISLASDNLRR